ncbi:MAG TPA: transposase [Ktedonobacteraceae bacterium]|jgi:putative transposase|nr:transposase [Ktedonobacteraceae bacterium]
MYQVRRVYIGKTPQVDELARECGKLYSQTVTSFWRVVRKQGLWLKPKHLMRWYTSDKLHAHTADACIQAFFASLNSWRARRKSDPNARPPRRRRSYFRIKYKSTAIRLRDGKLTLSNGKGNQPLILEWQWETPKTVVIHWTGTLYETIATYQVEVPAQAQGNKVAGIDLGEVHLAVSHDGEQTIILNGRLLRAKRQYQNKLKATLQAKIDVKQKGSRRHKRLARSKHKQLKKLKNQIKDIEHQQSSRLISTLHASGVQTVVIGDVRAIRQDLDVGTKNNQKLHQWSHGSIRHKLTYKAERHGMSVSLQEESYSSQTCPSCGKRSKPRGRVYRCNACRFSFHRDAVGAINIRAKYQGIFGTSLAVGGMAPPIGMRSKPHTGVARR